MKRTFAMVVALSCSLMLAHADRAHDIASETKSPSKGSLTQGDDYAQTLYQALSNGGVEAYVIHFGWGTRSSDEHWAAFVVYKDAAGRYWGRQSTSRQSKWLSGTTPQEWTASFYANAFTAVREVADNRDGGMLAAAGAPMTTPF